MARRARGMGSSEPLIGSDDAILKAEAEIAENYMMYGEIDRNIWHRFTLEPRGAVTKGNWMVIWDKYTGDYIRRKENPREYMSFRNSEDAMKWLRQQWVNTTKKETESDGFETDKKILNSAMKIKDFDNVKTKAKLTMMGFKIKPNPYDSSDKTAWFIWKPDRYAHSVMVTNTGVLCMNQSTSWFYRGIPYVVYELFKQDMLEINTEMEG